MKQIVAVFSLTVILAFTCSSVRAVPVELNLDRAYNFEFKDVVVINSPVDIYVANNFDPLRWKVWDISIGIPVGQAPLTQIQVDYDNTVNHSDPFIVLNVPLVADGQEVFRNVTYNVYSVSSGDLYGTRPVNGTGQFPYVGNPAWVSFHFDVNMDPIVYIKDACIPEPATMALLGLVAHLL